MISLGSKGKISHAFPLRVCLPENNFTISFNPDLFVFVLNIYTYFGLTHMLALDIDGVLGTRVPIQAALTDLNRHNIIQHIDKFSFIFTQRTWIKITFE